MLGYQTKELHPLLYLALYDVFDHLLGETRVSVFIYHERVDENTRWLFCSRGSGLLYRGGTEYFEDMECAANDFTVASYQTFREFKAVVQTLYRKVWESRGPPA